LSGQSALSVQVLTSHTQLPVLDDPQALYALVSLSLRADAALDTLPLNLCLVLDHSTSMQGPRQQAVQAATRRIVDRLRANDSLSLVVFNDRADVLLPARRNVDKAMVKAALSVVQPAGGTELLQGLGAGIREVVRGRTKTSLNYVVLLTDGRTYGDEAGCMELAKWAGEHQIQITAMGIGEDWNEDMLDEVARLSGGRAFYIDAPQRVPVILDDAIRDLTHVAVRQCTLRVVVGPSTTLHEAYMVAPEVRRLSPTAEDQPSAWLGPLGAGERHLMLLEFHIQAAAPPGRQSLASVRVEADMPGRPSVQSTATAEVMVELVPHTETGSIWRMSRAGVPSAIPSALARVALFRMQEKVGAELAAGRTDAATQRLEAMAVRLAAMGEMDLARSAMLEAGQMARTGMLSPEGRKKIRYGTRALSLTAQGEHHD
jgi:Ca-activated chloride channel family protein